MVDDRSNICLPKDSESVEENTCQLLKYFNHSFHSIFIFKGKNQNGINF